MQRMLELYRKADNKIIDVAQDTYLWLWDRTGIYLATISMLFALAWATIGRVDWITIIGLGLFGVIQGRRYLLQDKQQFEALNLMAKIEREWKYRDALSIMMYVCLLVDLITMDAFGIIRTISLIIYMILHCVMLRKRDKKPFFEAAPKLAPEAT